MIDENETINSYFETKELIYSMFKYESNEQSWIEDYRDFHWMLIDDGKSGKIITGRQDFKINDDLNFVYNYLHFNVYRAQTHTMIRVDTSIDKNGIENKRGGWFLFIFNNNLECKDYMMNKVYREKLIKEAK